MSSRSLLCLLMIMTAAGCDMHDGSRASNTSRPVVDIVTNDPKVVMFIIDGPRHSDTFGDPTHQYIPGIWTELKPQGTVYANFRNNGWTLTVSGHASMLTGTWQMLDNEGLERPDMPTLFEYYRAYTGAAADDAVLIGGKSKLAALSYSTHASYGAMYGASERVGPMTDTEVYGELMLALQNDKPHLVVVSMSQVDIKAHSGVWDDYTDQIAIVDSLAVATWSYLQSDPFYAGQTYFFITADHGRHDDQHGGFKSHGDSCQGCQHLIFLALGPDIQSGHVVPQQLLYSQPDLGATVASILGIPATLSQGNVMLEMFEPVATGIR